MVRPWQRLLLGSALVAVVAVAGIVANFALLRLTQDARDPVGRLGPRVVFTPAGTSSIPARPVDDDDVRTGHDADD